VALLAAQLDSSTEFFLDRLAGLTDEEYLWEPVAGAWSLRPRAAIRTGHSTGAGPWAFEYEPRGPKPAPMRTIAWLMWHLAAGCAGRADWTNGTHTLRDADFPCPPTAAGGVAQLTEALARWRSVFAGLAPEEYAIVGRSQYPRGLDPDLPLRDILWWQNREVIHHAAEISLLRDLYLWKFGTS
jgi:hypothetical protein